MILVKNLEFLPNLIFFKKALVRCKMMFSIGKKFSRLQKGNFNIVGNVHFSKGFNQ